MAVDNQKLAFVILEFLEKSIVDGSVRRDDKTGIEAAIQCIGEAFGVNPSDEAQSEELSIKPANLQSLFDVYLNEMVATPETIETVSRAVEATTGAPSNSSTACAANKSQAEQLRFKGNELMASKEYAGAMAAYTSAIALDPTNALYYSNRAAAHSSSNNHKGAVKDAQRAIEIDSNDVHAYYRLGYALYCLGDYQESANVFQRGLYLDPSNANLKSGRDHANARTPSTSTVKPTPEPTPPTPVVGGGGATDLNQVIQSLGGATDLSRVIQSLGGAPDLSQVIQSLGGATDLSQVIQSLGRGSGGSGGIGPIVQIVNTLMAQSGGLEGLFRDPAINNMMTLLQSGDMTSTGNMSNPVTAIMDIVSTLMGGANGARSGSM